MVSMGRDKNDEKTVKLQVMFDPVEFVCCLSAVDHKTHLKAFFNLVNMLQTEQFKQKLRECRTPAEAARIIEEYEYGL